MGKDLIGKTPQYSLNTISLYQWNGILKEASLDNGHSYLAQKEEGGVRIIRLFHSKSEIKNAHFKLMTIRDIYNSSNEVIAKTPSSIETRDLVDTVKQNILKITDSKSRKTERFTLKVKNFIIKFFSVLSFGVLYLPFIVHFRRINEARKDVNEVQQALLHLNSQDAAGETALIRAIGNRDTKLAKQIIIWGGDVSLKTKNMKSALDYAVHHDNLEVLQLLLSLDKFDQNEKNSALKDALDKKNMELINALLSRGAKFDLTTSLVTNFGNSNLLIDAIKENKLDFLDFLIAQGANLDLTDYSGNTALLVAASKGNFKLIKKLIDAGANCQIKNKLNSDCLMLSVKSGNLEIVKLFIEKGINPKTKNILGHNFLMLAILNGKNDVTSYLLDKVDLNDRDTNGNTALMLAINAENSEIVEMLINAKVNISLINKDNTTAWILAAKCKNKNILKSLLGPCADSFLSVFRDSIPLKYNEMDIEKWEMLRKYCRSTDSAGDLLILPLLFNDKYIKIDLNLTDKELKLGKINLEKRFPKNHIEYFLSDNAHRVLIKDFLFINMLRSNPNNIDPHHIERAKKILGEAITIPTSQKEENLDDLLTMFDKINFTDRKKPGYVNPTALKNDRFLTTIHDLRIGLKTYIHNLKNRTPLKLTLKDFEDAIGSKTYYNNLINQANIIINKIKNPEFDKDIQSSVLIDLAAAGSHECAARYKGDTSRWCLDLLKLEAASIKSIAPETIIDSIDKILIKFRESSIDTVVAKLMQKESNPMGPHYKNELLFLIGDELAIPGSELAYKETEYSSSIEKNSALSYFFEHYTREAILNLMDVAINGPKNDKGVRQSHRKELDAEAMIAWFRDSMPTAWKLKEYKELEDKTNLEIQTIINKFKSDAISEKEFNDYATRIINKKLSGIGISALSDPLNTEALKSHLQNQVKKEWGTGLLARHEANTKKILEQVELIKQIKNKTAKTEELNIFIDSIIKMDILEPKGISVIDPRNKTEIADAIHQIRVQDFLDKEVYINDEISMTAITKMMQTLKVIK